MDYHVFVKNTDIKDAQKLLGEAGRRPATLSETLAILNDLAFLGDQTDVGRYLVLPTNHSKTVSIYEITDDFEVISILKDAEPSYITYGFSVFGIKDK